jgi:16S rRNA (adenine1518-N6/adenine1519-N6)-dimethyltransferase
LLGLRRPVVELLSPATMLAKYRLAPSKGRGQNFLEDPNVIRKIVDAMAVGPDDVVVEVGSGFGALTFGLVARARHVVAVELDSGIVRAFTSEYGEPDGLTLVAGDILDLDFADVRNRFDGRKLVVAGNIPYSVTSPLIAKLVDVSEHVSRAVLMVQAEVGDRLVAAAGTKAYGKLSVVVQFHAGVRQLFIIRNTCFIPQPKVDSLVIEIDFAAAPVRSADAATFEKVVAAAFGKRRKMLRGALGDMLRDRGLTVGDLERASGIDLSRRGETLSIEEFERLALMLEEGNNE